MVLAGVVQLVEGVGVLLRIALSEHGPTTSNFSGTLVDLEVILP